MKTSDDKHKVHDAKEESQAGSRSADPVDEPLVTLPKFVAGSTEGLPGIKSVKNPERAPGADTEWTYEPPEEEKPKLEPPAGRWWAGWLSDPLHRFTYRYWDGSEWTEHVSDGGIVSVDPIPT